MLGTLEELDRFLEDGCDCIRGNAVVPEIEETGCLECM
jgi:hypothetical protein